MGVVFFGVAGDGTCHYAKQKEMHAAEVNNFSR